MFYYLLKKYFASLEAYALEDVVATDGETYTIFGPKECLQCNRSLKKIQKKIYLIKDRLAVAPVCARCGDRNKSDDFVFEKFCIAWDYFFKKAIKRKNQKQIDQMIEDYDTMKRNIYKK